ncbi:MAG: rhodanese-like domain-containing protein, partial [Kofleriaceae bacterium]
FDQGHIVGAVSVPLNEVKAWARDAAPRRKPIVAYCRGPYCVYAIDAVSELTKHGLRAMRLEDGPVEWRAAGYPIERGGAA